MKLNYFLLALFISTMSFAQTTVITDLDSPFELITQDNIAYITDTDAQRIISVDLSENTPVATIVLENIIGATSILIDGPDVYIAQDEGLITRRSSEDFTSNEVTIATGLDSPQDMVIRNNTLYVTEFRANGRVRAIDLLDGSLSTLTSGLLFPQELTFIGDELFIAVSGAVMSLNITDASPTTVEVISGLNNPAGLYAAGNILYISEFDTNGNIFSIDVSEETPSLTEVTTNLASPYGMSSFDNDLYVVVRGTGGDPGSLLRIDDVVLSVDQVDNQSLFSLYPNPSNGTFTIDSHNLDTLKEISVYDITGRLIAQEEVIGNNLKTISLGSSISSGHFLVKLTTTSGNTTTKKLIIK